MKAVLMRWDWVFMKQNVSFWFFDQSMHSEINSCFKITEKIFVTHVDNNEEFDKNVEDQQDVEIDKK